MMIIAVIVRSRAAHRSLNQSPILILIQNGHRLLNRMNARRCLDRRRRWWSPGSR